MPPALRSLLYSTVLLCFCGCATAQHGSGKPPNKKAQQLFTTARAAYDAGDWRESQEILGKLLAKYNPVPDYYYLQALILRRQGKYPEALEQLQAGQKRDENPSPQLLVEKAELYALLGDFDQQVFWCEQYVQALASSGSTGRQQQAAARLARARTAASIARQPVPFRPEPVPGGINTPEHQEYFPSPSPDGRVMIFTRRVDRQNEDFYRSVRQADGQWSVAEPLEGINTAANEGAQSITADGNYLVFTSCGPRSNRGSCDLFYSERDAEGRWSRAASLGRNINTPHRETQPALSADGRLLFFTSDRPGGVGGEDLYVSGRDPEGHWGVPVNLGSTINTSGHEQYPFWAADGQTLFFTSDKHPGLGGQDLFRSRLTPQNTWETPKNLGYPINTASNETNLAISLDGQIAWFSKQLIDPATGNVDVDLYRFTLPAALRPALATYLAASVRDKKSQKPLPANVQVVAIDGSSPPRTFSTDAAGKFLTVLPTGRAYAVTIAHEGYLFYSRSFELTDSLSVHNPFELEIELEPIETVTASETPREITFQNVLFATGSATLLPVSYQELDRLSALLQEQTSLRVTISGHTDNQGNETANQQLSEARAAAVSQYLQAGGIAANRIETVGYGANRPVANNDTPEGRALNRRTTFRLEK